MSINQNIVIIDYGLGNIHSVHHRLNKLGISSSVTANHDEINNATKLILPGVGHFKEGMNNLKKYDLIDILNKKVQEDNTPILGICLGMQLFAEYSEEGNVEGLGWIKGKVVRFQFENHSRFKTPHMGWNNVNRIKESVLLSNISKEEYFYFVHSYYWKCDDKNDVIGVTNYGYDFISCIEKNNIFGTQFHPEKSHDSGIKILQNFLNI